MQKGTCGCSLECVSEQWNCQSKSDGLAKMTVTFCINFGTRPKQVKSLSHLYCMKWQADCSPVKERRHRLPISRRRWTFSFSLARSHMMGKQHHLFCCQIPVRQRDDHSPYRQIHRSAFLLLDIQIPDDWMQKCGKSYISGLFYKPKG